MDWLAPVWLFAAAALLDLLVGDPVYRLHPIRLIGSLSTGAEACIRRLGGTGFGGGLLHLLVLLSLPLAVWFGVHAALACWHPLAAWIWDLYICTSLLCLRDLLGHGIRVLRAPELDDARHRVAMLVGRDTDRMDEAAVRRATIESMAENLVDGVLTPALAFALAGLPGLIVIKTISTLDSMIGYRNERYLRFGRWAARLDDLVNLLPARLSPLLLALGCPLFGLHAGSCMRTAWRWHALLPGPNSGWSEAAMAGALRLRLLGPIHTGGQLVNDRWLGAEDWPSAADSRHLARCLALVGLVGLLWTAACALATCWIPWTGWETSLLAAFNPLTAGP